MSRSDISHILAEPEHRKMCDVAIEYINRLYLIEALGQVNTSNIDLITAHQFAEESDAVWKDDEELVRQYLEQHRPELMAYVYRRCLAVVKYLVDGIDDLDSDFYMPVPMSHNALRSVMAALDNDHEWTRMDITLLDSDILKDKLDETYPQGNRVVRVPPSNFMRYEMADRVLRSVFDTAVTTQPDLQRNHFKQKYGAQRLWILDNRVSLCRRMLERCYELQSIAVGKCAAEGYFGHRYDNFGMWATLLGIFYRSATPVCMHPNRLERYYEQLLAHTTTASKAIADARPYCWWSIENVLGVDQLPSCPTWDDGRMIRTKYNAFSGEDSLTERFLVVSHLARHTQDVDAECFVS